MGHGGGGAVHGESEARACDRCASALTRNVPRAVILQLHPSAHRQGRHGSGVFSDLGTILTAAASRVAPVTTVGDVMVVVVGRLLLWVRSIQVKLILLVRLA